jgi:pimeloyl-ACP methyl ester carboxylesterase
VSEHSDYKSIRYRSDDGLVLFARDYNTARRSKTPVLCLSGLTRSSKDFETVAPILAQERRVICVDFRGRGNSQYAADLLTYRPDIELADTILLLRKLNIERVAIIGTSRGGIVGMLMAGLQPEMLAGLFLNDIGPVLDAPGLLRIRSYLGVDPHCADWEQAMNGLRKSNPGFKDMTQADWLRFAKRVFASDGDVPRLDYDVGLVKTFPTVDDVSAGRVPQLWELFSAIGDLPISVLRGENSDLLSDATVTEMKRVKPQLDATVVANRGHAPFLDEPESHAAIMRWLLRVDVNEKGRINRPPHN